MVDKTKDGLWISKMHMKKGALHKELGIKEDKKIPKKALDKAAKKPGIEGKRARLAKTLESIHKK